MPERTEVMRSTAGRDKGTLLAAVGVQDGSVLVADGRRRPLSRPKKKNPRHMVPTDMTLPEEALGSDRALRRALRRAADLIGNDVVSDE